MRFILAIIVFCFSIQGCAFSQNEFEITSIYHIPNSNYYLISVKESGIKKETRILSEMKDTIRTTSDIKVNDKITLTLKKYSDNSLVDFFPKERGSQVLFIDGIKVYDPNEQLFFAPCLDGLKIIKECDN